MNEPTDHDPPPGAGDAAAPADLPRRLRDAQALAGQLLDRLSDLAEPAPRVSAVERGPAVPRADGATALATARAIVRVRAERGRLFGDDLFSDPVWDVMLDAFIAVESGRRVSVSSICIAARVPTTTALRWCRQLEERGILVRAPDDSDRRRSFVMLSDSARERMHALLLTMPTGIL